MTFKFRGVAVPPKDDLDRKPSLTTHEHLLLVEMLEELAESPDLPDDDNDKVLDTVVSLASQLESDGLTNKQISYVRMLHAKYVGVHTHDVDDSDDNIIERRRY